ncbi:MAG TPA: preprotein translocase subunit SecE [Caulobacteraceae bacterium]|nr:preprotein translocase subunit SecE [Caulobacteraceae bacterium]
MAKDNGTVQLAARRRASARPLPPRPAQAGVPAPAEEPRKRFPGLVPFLREVRVEARKITWPSWRETWITSVMVGILVLITALFFFAVDWLLGLGMAGVLKLVNGV